VRFEPAHHPLNMAAVHRSADALIFPTLEDVWGLVVNEAMLCGVPVLCSKYAGCATELVPAESIFDPQNAVEFVRKFRDAVAGRLPKPDRSRLRSTREIVSRMVHTIKASVDRGAETVQSAPAGRPS
jgi:glycosyltransferase involved in cell wall biosynthesis